MTPLALVGEVVAEVLDEADVEPAALRARVAEKIAAALSANGFPPDPELEQEACSLLPRT